MDAVSKAESQAWDGLPQPAHSAFTPLGQIEQATKFAAGLKQTRHGWRRAVAVTGEVLIVLTAVAVVVAGVLSIVRQ
ncbi:hypothetical protein ACIBSW_06250 [Actinoplanes sp. NPDC049668]|uniref:hypothetical protein n=1 Tax=unclassified Actinoplanes TaxID=2626549 RepID=UPI0033B4DF05